MSHKTHFWLLIYLIALIFSIALIWRAWNELSVILFTMGGMLALLAVLGLLYAIIRLLIDLRLHMLEARARKQQLQIEAQKHRAELAREAERLAMERRDRERIAELEYLQFGLERHLSLTRVDPTEHGYPAILAEHVPYTQIPYQGKITVLPRSAGERGSLEARTGQDEVTPLALPLPRTLDFATVLRTWHPSPEEIFLFNTVEGAIYDAMEQTCHIGLAGTTGSGKTNCFRLILAQFLACGVDVYLANPNFAPIKLNGRTIEDWRPIVGAMRHPVAWNIDDIKLLVGNACKRLDERRARQQVSPLRGKDVYLALGEWPAIQSRWKEAAEPISQLLREARQYGLHVISEFQDALVKTLAVGSGVRECFRNAYYFGGDATTARTLLDLQGKGPLDETGLGEFGASLFRTHGKPAVRGRVPFLSNQALYMLLGFPNNPLPDRLPEGADPVAFFGDYGIPVCDLDGDMRDGQKGDGTPDSARAYPFSVQSPLSQVHITRQVATPGRPGEPITRPLSIEEKWPESRVGRDSGPVPASPDGPKLGPDDRAFTPEQAEEFLRRYRRTPDIKACLRQMNQGEGLSNRYHKHASWLVKTSGLRG